MSRLPQNLLLRLKKFYPENFLDILEGFQNKHLGSFRINSLYYSVSKNVLDEVLVEFSKKNIEIFEYSPFLECADFKMRVFCFDRKFEYKIKGTDAFYKGKIYLQSIASMIPVLVLNPKKNQKILDVCSAPGSKTTQIAMMTENSSKIVALEKNAIRYKKLLHNIQLQNVKNVTTYKVDALKFFSGELNIFCEDLYFDSILLDAPCSAEGRIFLEQEKSYGFWSMRNIKEKSKLQYQLLSHSIKKLKKGGVLVYSTCTLAPEENEEVVFRVLENFPEIFLNNIFEDLTEHFFKYRNKIDLYGLEIAQKTLKILPSLETEGFFVAKFTKI